MAFKFEKLSIWHLSLELTDEVDLLAQSFPKHELYALSSQMRRASYSVSLNIVEGSTGLTDAEFRRFLVIANRSALEVVGCLYLAKRRKYLDEEKFTQLYVQVEKLVIKIQAMIKKLND